MFGNVKGDTNSLSILIPKSYLYIHFMPFHILTKNPHLASPVQLINDRALNIILNLKTFDYNLTLQRRNLQQQQGLSVLWPVIPKENSKHLRLDVELLQETIYIIYSNHITNFCKNK